jgi:hypothetical protein
MTNMLKEARKKAQTTAVTEEKEDRLHIVEVAELETNESSREVHDLLMSHKLGKQMKKEGTAMFERAKRLHIRVTDMLFSDRSQERPKRVRFTTTDAMGEFHSANIVVKEGGYRDFDDDTKDKIVEIVGQEWYDKYFTSRIMGEVNFNMVPEAKQDQVYEMLMAINEAVGVDVAEVSFANRPLSTFHSARADLLQEQDVRLNKEIKMPIAFSR